MEFLRLRESLLIVERDAQQAQGPRIAGVRCHLGSQGLFGGREIASLHRGRRGLHGRVLIRTPAGSGTEPQNRT
jgi:hypothetical protein